MSDKSATPQFDDIFYLPLTDYSLVPHQRLIVSAFVVVDTSNNVPENGAGQAKHLGEGIIELAALTDKLTNIPEQPVTTDVDLIRKINAQNAIVGKLTLKLRLRYEIVEPKDIEKVIPNDEMNLLPEMDFSHKFVWRLRIHIRSAVNLPSTSTSVSMLPSAYIEGGWTMYANDQINNSDSVRTPCVEKNKHPIWNQELLYYPPSNVDKICGFFHIILKDRYQMTSLERFSFPINSLKSFHPVNLDLKLKGKASDEEMEIPDKDRSHLYLSFTLEDAPIFKISESYVNILINAFNFDPLPKCTDRVNIIMTTNKIKPPSSLYNEVDLQDPNHINQILDFLKTSIPYSCFISNTITIPPKRIKNPYYALTNFIIPRTVLDMELSFFVFCKDTKLISIHNMPNVLSGEITLSTDDLKSSYFSKKHEVIPFKVLWYNESSLYGGISHSRGVVEISVRPVEDSNQIEPHLNIDDVNYSQIKEKMLHDRIGLNNVNVNLNEISEKEKWDVVSKELTQKQELIHRMMKEVDEKAESLKLTSNEIIELRKQIKLLQSENQILRRRLGQEEQMQIEALVTQEIHRMSLPELKSKIVKLAQAYRGERMRNEEFEKALKQAQNEISNARKIANELEQFQKVHEEDETRFISLQKETQKIGLYRETIKKQEEVIVKMEGLLKKTMDESEKQKEGLIELEALRTENLKLQKELKDYVINVQGNTRGGEKRNIELEKVKVEIYKMQQLVNELQSDLKNKRPMSGEKREIQSNMMQMEVRYHKAEARIKSLEEELEINTRNYAKEISALKLILAEKQALIETMRMENAS